MHGPRGLSYERCMCVVERWVGGWGEGGGQFRLWSELPPADLCGAVLLRGTISSGRCSCNPTSPLRRRPRPAQHAAPEIVLQHAQKGVAVLRNVSIVDLWKAEHVVNQSWLSGLDLLHADVYIRRPRDSRLRSCRQNRIQQVGY